MRHPNRYIDDNLHHIPVWLGRDYSNTLYFKHRLINALIRVYTYVEVEVSGPTFHDCAMVTIRVYHKGRNVGVERNLYVPFLKGETRQVEDFIRQWIREASFLISNELVGDAWHKS